MDVEELIKKKIWKMRLQTMNGNGINNIRKRLKGWQLESFEESYKYKIENGVSLLKKNQLK